jgi:hypothetical protein
MEDTEAELVESNEFTDRFRHGSIALREIRSSSMHVMTLKRPDVAQFFSLAKELP